MYGCKCPVGGCPKANQWLGNKRQAWFSEKRARQAIFDHLSGSPKHADLNVDMCTAEADMAEISSWAVDQDQDLDDEAMTAEQRAQMEEESVYYDDSEARAMVKRRKADPASGTVAKSKPSGAGGGGGGGGHGGGGAAAVARISNTLEQQIHTQTRNAYIFVKAGLTQISIRPNAPMFTEEPEGRPAGQGR